MAAFTVDHSKASQGRYMAPEGFYECVISEVKLDQTQSGKEYLRIFLTVRDDVDQDGQNESIDWPVWKRREPGRNDPNGFPLGTIQHISRVTKLANGLSFESFDDWMTAITRKPIKVEIRHEEYNGNTRAKVAYVFETERANMSLGNQGFVEVDEGELPF